MRFGPAILLAAIAMLLFGCVYPGITNEELLDKKDMTPYYANAADFICRGLDDPLPCYCNFCEKESDWPSWLSYLSSKFDATLTGGRCMFLECSQTTFDETLHNNADMFIRTVALGHGPSFVSTDLANSYCSNALQLASKWMIGINTPPQVPNQSRAVCWLDRNILPVYMYYTNGAHISATRSQEIADEFSRSPRSGLTGAGPVLLTTEVALDSSNSVQVRAVKEQIRAYDSCDRCLTVLAVKSNDTRALRLILEDPTIYTTTTGGSKNLSQMVDVVGFGFRANDYTNCTAEKVIGPNYAFSRYILSKYSKPSIWLYVGASEGPNVDNTCSWSPVAVHNFYQNLFALTQGMASSGVMGFSFYEFIDGTGPLACNGIQGCEFGVLKADGSQKNPEINTWASLCKYYSDDPVGPAAIERTQYRSPLVFSRNGQGPRCDFVQNTKLFNKLSSEVNPDPALIGTEQAGPPIITPGVSCGEVCVADHPVPDPAIYDNAGVFFNPFHCGMPEGTAYLEIDEMADDADISSNYFRALVEEMNNNYDDIKVSFAPLASLDCNPFSYNMIQLCVGVSGVCPDYITPPAGQKPCEFGLSQTKEYPGPRYPDPNTLPPDIVNCGGVSYNPFNPTMSICSGIKKFKRYLGEANQFVEDNWAELSRCSGTMADEDKPWAAYFLATFLYHNESFGPVSELPSVIDWITNVRDHGGACSAGQNNNYIKYTRNYYTNFTARVMSRYFSALFFCDSSCKDCCGDT